MIIKLYLSSVLISALVTYVTAYALAERLKREYPDVKSPKATIIEKIHSSFVFFIPIFNIFPVVASLFFSEEVYTRAVKEIEGVAK